MTCTDVGWTTIIGIKYSKENPMWLWNPQTELPTIHETKKIRKVIAPHIRMRSSKRFQGTKFKLGRSRK